MRVALSAAALLGITLAAPVQLHGPLPAAPSEGPVSIDTPPHLLARDPKLVDSKQGWPMENFDGGQYDRSYGDSVELNGFVPGVPAGGLTDSNKKNLNWESTGEAPPYKRPLRVALASGRPGWGPRPRQWYRSHSKPMDPEDKVMNGGAGPELPFRAAEFQAVSEAIKANKMPQAEVLAQSSKGGS